MRSTATLWVGGGPGVRKAPTGSQNQYDVYNDNNGANPTSKPIDQSIEPGDGGWGAQIELQGFTRIGRTFVFGSANYLLNPKDVNDAPSGRAAGDYQRNFNSHSSHSGCLDRQPGLVLGSWSGILTRSVGVPRLRRSNKQVGGRGSSRLT